MDKLHRLRLRARGNVQAQAFRSLEQCGAAQKLTVAPPVVCAVAIKIRLPVKWTLRSSVSVAIKSRSSASSSLPKRLTKSGVPSHTLPTDRKLIVDLNGRAFCYLKAGRRVHGTRQTQKSACSLDVRNKLLVTDWPSGLFQGCGSGRTTAERLSFRLAREISRTEGC